MRLARLQGLATRSLAMANAFKTELLAMQVLLTQQSASMSSIQFNNLASLQSDAFARRANELTDLNIELVTELTQVIQSGPWSAPDQSKLIVALANSLSGVHLHAEKKKNKRPCQTLMHFRNYPNASEHARLQCNDVAFTAKLATALDVLGRIQAVLLNETSKRRVLATVAAGHHQPRGWPVQELRDWYVTFKNDYATRFKDKRADAGIGHIKDYPESPTMLPQPKFSIMFDGDSHTPFAVDLDLLRDIERNIWCRGDAVALRPKSDAIVRQQPAQSNPPPASDMGNPMQAMCMMMMNMMQQNQQHTNQSDANIEITRPPPIRGVRGRSSSSASIDGPKAIEDAPQVSSPLTPKEQSTKMPLSSPLTTHKPTLSPQEQANRFLNSLQGHAVADDDDDDDKSDDATTKSGKGSGKGTRKKDAKSKTKANADKAKAKGIAKSPKTTTAKTGAKAKALVFNPVIALEATRSQYLFRPGLSFAASGESSKAFPFSANGGKAGAFKAATKWLKDFKASHKCK